LKYVPFETQSARPTHLADCPHNLLEEKKRFHVWIKRLLKSRNRQFNRVKIVFDVHTCKAS